MTQAVRNSVLGDQVRAERKRRLWTLAELSSRSGLSISALSKVENGRITLGYNSLGRIAQALGIDVARLFAPPTAARRSLTRRGEGELRNIEGYELRYLAADLLQKRFVPMVTTVKARSLDEAGGLKRHEGEEVYFVLSGSVELHTDTYAPITMKKGDCVYMDGTVAHALVSLGRTKAEVFSVNEGFAVYAAESGVPVIDLAKNVRSGSNGPIRTPPVGPKAQARPSAWSRKRHAP